MDHSIDECPEQDVREEATGQTARQNGQAGAEELVPRGPSLEQEQEPEEDSGEDVEDESLVTGQSQNPGRTSCQRRHGRPAVLQQRVVLPNGQLRVGHYLTRLFLPFDRPVHGETGQQGMRERQMTGTGNVSR